MGKTLNDWLQGQLQEKGWSLRELSRRSDLSDSYISNIMSGKREPGAKFYMGVAKAFDLDAAAIERLDREGIDPGNLAAFDEAGLSAEIIRLVQALPPEEKREVLRYVIYLSKRG